MRGRRGGNLAGGGLRAGLSQASGGGAGGRTLLAYAAARRSLDCKPDFFWPVWRRRRRGTGFRPRARIGWARNSRHAIGVLSEFGARHGMGYFGEGFSDCVVARSA